MPCPREPTITYFYPRPPRGGRPVEQIKGFEQIEISIHALREEGDATSPPCCEMGSGISIHALREEGDPGHVACEPYPVTFLSTPSARRATCGAFWKVVGSLISIHALREEGDMIVEGK